MAETTKKWYVMRAISGKENKVKEYAYNTNGSWEASWATSSVVSITIDGQHIESCGSTVLFYDTRLTPLEIDIPKDVTTIAYNMMFEKMVIKNLANL